MKLFDLILSIVFFILTFALQAQADRNYFYRNITTENGLSQNSVSQIMQDRHGMVWIATQAGVDKYVGNRILPVEGFQKQLTESVTGLFDWNEKHILVFTDSVNYFIHKWSLKSKKAPVLYKNIQYCLTVKGGDKLIVTDSALIKVDHNFKELELWFISDEKNKKVKIYQVLQGKSQRFYLATTQGLYTFTQKEGPRRIAAKQIKKVYSICFNADSSALYYGAENMRLYELDLKTETQVELDFQDSMEDNASYVNAILLNDKQLWIGTKSNGLYIYDVLSCKRIAHFHSQKNAQTTSQYLSSRYVNCLYQTKDGVIWVGTSAGGLNTFPSKQQAFHHALNRNNDYRYNSNLAKGNDIWSMLLDPLSGYLFAGLKANGVAVIDTHTSEVKYWLKAAKEKPRDTSVLVLKRLHNTLFLGTNAGLYRYDLRQLGRSEEYHKVWPGGESGDAISILAYDEVRKVWWAGKRGGKVLYRYNQSFGLKSIALNQDQDRGVLSFIETINQQVLVGTTKGVYRLDDQDDKNPHLLPLLEDNQHYTCILPVDNSRIWLGTDRKGLHEYLIKEGKLTLSTSIPFKEVIYDLQRSRYGNIWLSTNHGLYQYCKKTTDFNHYETNNGLSVHEFNKGASASDSRGQLFFGGSDGLDFFAPLKMGHRNGASLHAVLQAKYTNSDSIYIFDYNNLHPQKLLRLPYRFGSLEIELMLGDYRDPFNNQFKLYLNGDTIKPTPDGRYLIFEQQLNNNLPLSKKNRLQITYRASMGSKLETKDVHIRRIFFSGANFLLLPSVLLFFVIWVGLQSNRRYKILQTRMNEISQLDQIEAICTTALGHLVNDLNYDYAAISLVDFEEKRIQIAYIKDDKKTPAEIDEWKNLSSYPLHDDDILAQIASSAENVVVIGSWIMLGKVRKAEQLFNAKIFDKFKHIRVARVFVPIIHREQKDEKEKHAVLGVIEVGYHFKWTLKSFNLFRYLTNRRLRLNIYADNLAQPYFKAYMETHKEEIYKYVEQLEKESSAKGEDHNGFLLYALGQLAQKMRAEYGDISLTTFNSKKIDFQFNTLLYGYTRTEADWQAAHEKNKDKEGIINHVAQTKNYYYSNNVHQDDKYLESMPDVKSELAIPMLLKDSYLAGVFNFMSRQENHFNPILATKYQKGINKLTDLYLQKKQFFSLQKISTPVGAFSFTDDALYHSMVQALREYFKSEYISVWMRQSPGSRSFTLSPKATISEFYQEYAKLGITYFKIENEYKSTEEWVELKKIEDLKEGSRIQKLFTTLGFKAYIQLKIVVDDRYHSFINVFSKREIDNEEVTGYSRFLLNEVSKRVALSSWNIRLTNAIDVISKSLAQRERENPLKKIVDQAYQLSPAVDSVVLYPYVKGKTIRINDAIYEGTLPKEDIEDTERPVDFANYIIKHGTQWIESETKYLEIIHGLADSPELPRTPFWTRRGLQSIAAIRLEFGKEPIGVMFFNYHVPKHFKTDETRPFIEAFTNFATIALVNEDYIRKIQEARHKLSQDLSLLSERQAEMKKESAKLQKNRDEIQDKNNELELLLEKILPRAAGASFFLILQGVNHDIRTFLFEIQAQLINFSSTIPEKHHKLFNKLKQDIEDTALQIANLLALFDPNVQNTKESVAINEVFDQVLGFFKKSHSDRIVFKSEYNKSLPALACNKAEFSMIFYNLVKNATQAMPKPMSGEIIISAYFKDKFIISVRDTGEGIEKQAQDKIFDLRYTTKPEGIGVGLYFVKETIENKLNGRIRVESYKGKGTTFWIEIPNIK